MEATRQRPRGWALALALICAGVLAAAPAAELADAKDRRVGTYRGEIELPSPSVPSSPATGGSVSFRITKKQKVVGFTAADVPVYTISTIQDPSGGSFIQGTFSHRTTFTVPTMSLQGVARFFYTNRSTANPPPGFQGYEVLGKPGGTSKLKGYVFYEQEANPPAPQGQDQSSFKQVWTAEKVRGKKKN
jgi:hypothetical protein